ncbi:MAG: bacteriohemerythrin [Candidatus Bathyarchaeia archaeon]
MPIMQWNDSLSVSVRSIDAQHKMLLKHLNDLADAMSQGKAKDALMPILSQLVAYTQMHFSTEEKYMQQWNFPQYEAHKNEHNAFVDQVAQFQKDFQAGKAALSVQVLKFLKDWVANHIKETDKNYGSFFNSHGLT